MSAEVKGTQQAVSSAQLIKEETGREASQKNQGKRVSSNASGSKRPGPQGSHAGSSKRVRQEAETEDAVLEPEWPKHLLPLRDRTFEDQEALDKALAELGYGDEAHVHLGEGGRVFVTEMPSDPHHAATTKIQNKLSDWRLSWRRKEWGVASSTTRMKVDRAASTTSNASREPDNSFWTFDRCDTDEGDLSIKLSGHGTGRMDPSVVIQVSWKNKEDYEIAALDDMMNNAGQGRYNKRCVTGVLIKMQFDRRGQPSHLVIYKVRQGQRVNDVMTLQQYQGQRWTYTPGPRNPDVVLKLSASEMGFTGFWSLFAGSFKLSMKALWKEMMKESK